MTAALVVRTTDDPGRFAAVVAPLVAADPVVTSVLATNLARYRADPVVGEALWVWVERDGVAVGAAMRTPSRPLHLATHDVGLGEAVARELGARGLDVRGVGGPRPVVEAFAAVWSAAHGTTAQVAMAQGVHELTSTVELRAPEGVPGALRAVRPDDRATVVGWATAFQHEIGEPPVGDDPAPAAERIAADPGLRVWDAGGPVAMAYASRAHGGVSRVSWVYTPPEHRGRGFARACVAATTAERLAAGARCLLYTDLANPTSNATYAAIGYRRTGDAVNLRW